MRTAILIGLVVLIAWGLLVLGQDGQSPPSPQEMVVREMLVVLDKLTGTLATIVDSDTATAAQPELKKLTAAFVEARQKSESLPQPSKEEKDRLAQNYQRKFAIAMEKFRSEVRRLEGIPAGVEALKELAPLELPPK